MVDKRFARAACGAALALLVATGARAGGGPENVFVVVNSASWASQAVANHFIELRHIPAINVFYIPWTGGFESVEGDVLRDKILIPTLDKIERRGLSNQIDYIIYSSDFPYAVDLAKDFPKIKFTEQATPGLSLNSATYLWNFVLSKLPVVMDVTINHYQRASTFRKSKAPTHGFHSWYGWASDGALSEAGGQPYMLSTMLAMTSGRGNSVREAIAYLRSSASADGTHPKGTIYFAKTDDVRSKARSDGFAEAVAELKTLGVRAQVISAAVPPGRNDVQGAMIGVADFSWRKSASKILPGAICEDFTSFGGQMGEAASQTPLSEFLRYGAAGSSGTVVEPYSIAAKFPTPEMHVHYARGCTLAESYYQSIFGPAQLLIVGDPLCRPWANIAAVNPGDIKPGAKISGTLVLKPTAKLPKGGVVDHFEWFVDGRRAGWLLPDAELTWDTTAEDDGYHELRVVAVEAGPIESQGRAIVPVKIDNHAQSVVAAAMPAGTVRWDEALKVRVRAPGMAECFVVHNGLELARITGFEGEALINPRQLGLGPVSLSVVATPTKGDLRHRVASPPIRLTIEPPKPLAAVKNVPSKLPRPAWA